MVVFSCSLLLSSSRSKLPSLRNITDSIKTFLDCYCIGLLSRTSFLSLIFSLPLSLSHPIQFALALYISFPLALPMFLHLVAICSSPFLAPYPIDLTLCHTKLMHTLSCTFIVFPSFMSGLLKVEVMKLSSGPLLVYCTSFRPFFLLATCLVGSCRASFVGRGRLATSYLVGNLVSSSILARCA